MPEGQETYVTARVLGTFGYFDPEYTSVSILTKTISFLLLIYYVLKDEFKIKITNARGFYIGVPSPYGPKRDY